MDARQLRIVCWRGRVYPALPFSSLPPLPAAVEWRHYQRAVNAVIYTSLNLCVFISLQLQLMKLEAVQQFNLIYNLYNVPYARILHGKWMFCAF